MFFCSECGNESIKWLGKCPYCQAWGSFKEGTSVTGKAKSSSGKAKKGGVNDKTELFNFIKKVNDSSKAILIHDIQQESLPRLITHDCEFNRVLGGGVVPGSVILVAGEPGIGKSTLLLQIALNLPDNACTLYVSGEESAQQIRLRADRIPTSNNQVHVLTEVSTREIFENLQMIEPICVIVDSIQTLVSPYVDATAGSILQIKECTIELQKYAKITNTPIFLVGHITKEGSIAGPKVLEHIVDAVIQFEGERGHNFRILRTLKNRFGSGTEIGVYEMKNDGLNPVENPSELFLSSNNSSNNGTAVGAVMEGIRPILIEVQSLVSISIYGTPQRTVKGFDLRKMQLILAVLEKHGGFQFGNKDVFLNIVGGFRSDAPSLDLAVMMAILSSFEERSISLKTCFIGEVGLSGELRAVDKIEKCILEVERLGFETVIIPQANLKHLKYPSNKIEIIKFHKVEEVYKYIFMRN